MNWMRIGLALLLAVLSLIASAGCRTETGGVTGASVSAPVSPVPAKNTSAAKTAYVELTYPQSDDQGHYVGLPQSDDVMVSGIVAAFQPPTGIVVNGVMVQPYPVEDVAPFGTPAGYST